MRSVSSVVSGFVGKPTGAPLTHSETRDRPTEASAEDSRDDSRSRALVTVAPMEVPRCRSAHADAAFVAQLIATRQRVPQTREKRRAAPDAAAAAYDDTMSEQPRRPIVVASF